VRGVRDEPSLRAECRLQASEQTVDGICEVLEFIGRTIEREPFVKVALGDLPGGGGHRPQGAKDAARDQPPKRDRGHGHDRQRDPGLDQKLVKFGGMIVERLGVRVPRCRRQVVGEARGGEQATGRAAGELPAAGGVSPLDHHPRLAGVANQQIRDRQQRCAGNQKREL